jgi:hypothetical protein
MEKADFIDFTRFSASKSLALISDIPYHAPRYDHHGWTTREEDKADSGSIMRGVSFQDRPGGAGRDFATVFATGIGAIAGRH